MQVLANSCGSFIGNHTVIKLFSTGCEYVTMDKLNPKSDELNAIRKIDARA